MTRTDGGDSQWGDWSRLAGTLPFTVRTVIGMTGLAVGANVAGAVVVGLLIIAVNASATHHQVVVLVEVAALLVGVSAVVGTAAGAIVQRRTLRWLLRGTAPTERDTRSVVRLPLEMGVIAFVMWTVDAIVIAVAAALTDANAQTVFGMGGGIVVAGLTAGGVTYLLVARAAQPVTKIALGLHPPETAPMFSVRSGLLINWLLTSALPVLGILMILIAPQDRSHVRAATIITAVLALAVGVFATALAARAIGKPLRTMVDALHRVGHGDLDVTVPVDNPGEIGLLQSGLNDMVAGLRERDRVQDLFGRHVGPAVAEEALRSGVTLSGESREVVALFVDITASTALTRRIEPVTFVAMLNRFFEVVVDEVESNGGLVNKFEGDAALCVFGAPVVLVDAASSALRAARRIRDRVQAAGEVSVGIGVAAGPVVAGQIGAPSRLEYTVIGDAVNEAARLTDLAKGVSGTLLASDIVVGRSDPAERMYWRDAGEVVLRGRDIGTRIWTA